MNCPACGAPACKQVYDEVTAYSVSLGDTDFVHQLVVDTYAAQHATLDTKPITVVFAVAGLYLVCERGYTGRQVQQAHMRMVRSTSKWPHIGVPTHQAGLSVADVLRVPEERRPEAIRAWCEGVWQTWANRREEIDGLLRQHAGWI